MLPTTAPSATAPVSAPYPGPLALRHPIRMRQFTGQTAGQCRGYTQANSAVLPVRYAAGFKLFCERNPKPCPVIGMSEAGSPHIPALGADLDIRNAELAVAA